MKDITAIFFIQNRGKNVLKKMEVSLHNFHSRIASLYIFHQPQKLKNQPFFEWCEQTHYMPVKNNDLGEAMNKAIDSINSTYILYLNEDDYLTGKNDLYLPRSKEVLITDNSQPVLIRSSILKRHPLPSITSIPFKEALFPAWLNTIKASSIQYEGNLVKRSIVKKNTDIREKIQFGNKYFEPKVKDMGTSLSILMTNYNMGKYVETAVASCILQNHQPEQILIMDDGSTDDSFQRLKKWRQIPRIHLFQQENQGKANALNNLLPHVTTDFFMELDADDWLDPDAIYHLKKNLTELPKETSLLYGNFRKWKQIEEDVQFKRITKGRPVSSKRNLLTYRFPLGPRIYRTTTLKEIGGFPVVNFKEGRLYEDVSVLYRLMEHTELCYKDFTVYNVREHQESITKNNRKHWNSFLENIRKEHFN